MATFQRHDGRQFTIHPYRETFTPKKLSAIKTEIKMLADSHGHYVRLFKQENGQVEAVFSQNPGYLLGEAIWQHFGKPKHLIYCEQINKTRSALIVVVRNTQIYLDNIIRYKDIPAELGSLATTNDTYDIYCDNKVPISKQPTKGKFSFEPNLVASFTQLDQPVLNLLDTNPDLQLQPLSLALRDRHIGTGISLRLPFTLLVLMIAGLIGWNYYRISPNQTLATHTPQNPYENYERVMQSPAPADQIAALIKLATSSYQPPGWEITYISLTGKHATLRVKSIAASVEALRLWAKHHKMILQVDNNGFLLQHTMTLPNRPRPTKIYPSIQTVSLLVDRMKRLFPDPNISLENSTQHGLTRRVGIRIHLENSSPAVLMLMANRLRNLPVVLNTIHAELTNGLFSGTMDLTVLGTAT